MRPYVYLALEDDIFATNLFKKNGMALLFLLRIANKSHFYAPRMNVFHTLRKGTVSLFSFDFSSNILKS